MCAGNKRGERQEQEKKRERDRDREKKKTVLNFKELTLRRKETIQKIKDHE